MKLMEKWIMHNIVVLENLQDNILESDCSNKNFLGYNAYKQFPVWETPPIDSGRLKTTERVYLDALSLRIVKIKCQDKEDKALEQNTIHW